MREILFKAKRIDNGEWVEGFYFCIVHDDGRHFHHFIMPLGVDLNLGTPIEKIQVEIDIDTISQYTGIIDKNGNRIWENDIVMANSRKYKIHYYVPFAMYMLSAIDNGGGANGMNIQLGNCEVIGNIFDNPELLEGDEQ